MPREEIQHEPTPQPPSHQADPPRAPRKRAKRAKRARRAPDVMAAPRRETHSDDFQIGHPSTIGEKTGREDVSRERASDQRLFGNRLKESGDVVLLDGIAVTPDYLDELAFYEEWLEILINPSTHKNAASIFENWSNGQGAEMLINGKPVIVRDLPVGIPITVKRKIVEQIIRARVTEVRTIYESTNVENPRNEIGRVDSRVHSFSILHDPAGEKGREWMRMAYARPI